jgi:hypothetical protein
MPQFLHKLFHIFNVPLNHLESETQTLINRFIQLLIDLFGVKEIVKCISFAVCP